MIYITNKDGNKKKLIYNENVLLTNIDDMVSFHIQDLEIPVDFTLHVSFSEDGKEHSTFGNISEDNKALHLTLYKWNDQLGVELLEPMWISTQSGEKIWLKLRTYADKKHSFRRVHVSVWRDME